MSRVPATLLYLTIYNPSLQPTDPILEDDEDAKEQAHILFYTSREKAVSRDRMLRQVGLAKALVNFSEMFNVEEVCNNVHSQSRRMIMIEPEPDFWIHAGIEVAKTPKLSIEKGKKGKGRETKSQEIEKGKDKGLEKEELVYDYHDASVHDLALRMDTLRAYEQFKLIHGSFTSILTTLGKEALELQLERFFTVWAWSWNLEEGHQFGPHLGVPLHPSGRSLTPHLDVFTSQLPQGSATVVFSRSFLIPSATFNHARYPPILSRYLMSRIPPSPPSTIHTQNLSDAATTAKLQNDSTVNSNGSAESQSTFLGMPTANMNVNVNVNMDVRKWSWPGYLTFGRNAGKKLNAAEPKQDEIRERTDIEEGNVGEEQANVDFDKDALEDAMTSDNVSVLIENVAQSDPLHPVTPGPDNMPSLEVSQPTETSNRSDDQDILEVQTHDAITTSGELFPSVETRKPEPSDTPPTLRVFPVTNDDPSLSSPILLRSDDQMSTITDAPSIVVSPKLSSIYVHLADSDDTLATRRQKVYYIIQHQLAVAIAGINADDDNEIELSTLAEKALGLLSDVEDAIEQEANHTTTDLLQPATNILEPKDRHIVSANEMTVSSPGFTSKSEHLFNAEQLFEKDPHILEVFSRGQNPQHWHIGRHGLGVDNDGVVVDGEIYVEVSRKETTITDVDNVVALLLQGYQANS